MDRKAVHQAIHDLNNLLMVIGSHASLLADAVVGDDQATRDVEQIREAARRAASVTKQLADTVR